MVRIIRSLRMYQIRNVYRHTYWACELYETGYPKDQIILRYPPDFVDIRLWRKLLVEGKV